VLKKVKEQATARYKVKAVVKRYMDSVEEVINLSELMKRLDLVLEKSKGKEMIEEIVLQSRVEFNVEDEEEDVLAFDECC
jgi:hypothetical protein